MLGTSGRHQQCSQFPPALHLLLTLADVSVEHCRVSLRPLKAANVRIEHLLEESGNAGGMAGQKGGVEIIELTPAAVSAQLPCQAT